MITKYRTDWPGKELIVPIEAERETEKSIWIKGRSKRKESAWENYHSSWNDAHDYLLGKAQSQLNSAKVRLNSAQSHFDDVKGLTEKKEK